MRCLIKDYKKKERGKIIRGMEKTIFLKQLVMSFGQTNDERKINQHS